MALLRLSLGAVGLAARPSYFLRALFFLFFGTFAPALRASDSPIAIACFLLVTLFSDRPLLSLPRFLSCIARLTLRRALVLLAIDYLPQVR
jgi:hypothetical protein